MVQASSSSLEFSMLLYQLFLFVYFFLFDFLFVMTAHDRDDIRLVVFSFLSQPLLLSVVPHTSYMHISFEPYSLYHFISLSFVDSDAPTYLHASPHWVLSAHFACPFSYACPVFAHCFAYLSIFLVATCFTPAWSLAHLLDPSLCNLCPSSVLLLADPYCRY